MKPRTMDPSDDDVLALCDLIFDALCERPLGDLLDVDRSLAAIDAMAEPARTAHWIERLWSPMRERVVARLGASEITLGAWIPEARRAKMLARAGGPAPIPRSIVEEVVGSERVREAVRGMINDTLTGFIQKASGALSDVGKGSAGSGGLRGAFGIGARVAGSMMAGLGEEVQSRLMDRVRDHLDGAVATVQTRIGERLRSEETAKALGKRRQQAVEKLLGTTEQRAVRDASKVDWAEINGAIPEIIAHNLGREALRAGLREDLGWIFEQFRDETLGGLLAQLGLRDPGREAFRATVAPTVRTLMGREAFRTWCAAHLRDATP